MVNATVRVQGLGKRYRIGEREPYGTLRDALVKTATGPFRRARAVGAETTPLVPIFAADRHIWALRDVSLQVREGEAVGLIGPNGSGKTTLLKILSRITEPTEGRAEVRGRLGSLLEIGTGFHQELTGRENIYLNGAILGMGKKEIEGKFDLIVDFSEIKDFIDTPVKRYSDGMRVRLGFAIAAHLEPDVLLVDEVLAVGDVAFQRKCLGKMGDVTGEGRTILFVSHDMAAIQNLCSTAYALDHGRVFASGDVNDVISEYLESVSRPQATSIADRVDRRGTRKLRITGFSVSGSTNSPDTARCGALTKFVIAFQGTPPLRNVEINMLFYNQFGTCALTTGNDFVGRVFEEIPERGTFVCRFDRFPLMPGIYHVRLACVVNGLVADDIKNAVTLQVVEGDYYGSGKLPPKGFGAVAVPHDWEVIG